MWAMMPMLRVFSRGKLLGMESCLRTGVTEWWNG
jgi:hypothetical protein